MSSNRRKNRSEVETSRRTSQPTMIQTYRPPSGVVMGSTSRGHAEKPSVTSITSNSPTWTDPSFLKACRDGEDDYIRHIMTSRRMTPDVVNYRDTTGKTGLSYICVNGSVPLLELIGSIKILDVNLADNEGNTPLHFAAQAGHIEVVHKLVDSFKMLQVDVRNNLGFTPLMKASLQGRTKCAKLLLATGASPVLRDHGRGLCASEWARYCGRQACAEAVEKFMKNCNYSSPVALRHRKELRELEKCNSEPNLQFLLSHSEVVSKDGNWLKQKLKRAFTKTSENGGGRKTVEYSLMTTMSNVALCASSPLVPTATVKGTSSLTSSSSYCAINQQRTHRSNGCDVTSGMGCDRDSSNNVRVLPKVQVTDVTSTSDAGPTAPTRSSQTYKAAYKASKSSKAESTTHGIGSFHTTATQQR